jgi:hypothetical protein
MLDLAILAGFKFKAKTSRPKHRPFNLPTPRGNHENNLSTHNTAIFFILFVAINSNNN